MNIPLSPEAAVSVAYGLNVLLLITVIAGVALMAARFTLRHDASARYVLCLTALICILLAPVVIGAMSGNRFGLVVYTLPAMAAPSPAPNVVPVTFSGAPTADLPPARKPAGRGLQLLVSIWAVGAVWGAVRLVRGWRTVIRLRQSVHPLDAGAYGIMLEQVQRTLGSIAPPIFTSERVVSPVAVGLLHPIVILPDGLAEALTPAQLRHVLLHECAHVAGHHAFGGVVQRLAGLLFWPHPLVAALCQELARTREEVCDNVASQEDGAACYARTLLTIAQGLSPAPQYASALALLGQETSLEQRISGLLDPRRNRMVGVKRWKLWAVTGGVTLTMVLAATVRVVAKDAGAQQETTQQEKAQQALEQVVRAEQAAAQAQVEQAQAQLIQARQALVQVQAVQAQATSQQAITRANRLALVKALQYRAHLAQVMALRYHTLQGKQFVAQADVEKAQHAAAQAQAAAVQAQAQQAAAQARLQQAQAELMSTQVVVVRTREEAREAIQRALELSRAKKGIYAPAKGTKAGSYVPSTQHKTSHDTATGASSSSTSTGSSASGGR